MNSENPDHVQSVSYSNLITEDKDDSDVEDEERKVKDINIKWTVRVTDLVKYYPIGGFMGLKAKKYQLALKGISFGIKPGTIFTLLGTNGAGKSTTFKILTGDIFANSGMASIMGFRMPENMRKIRNLVGYCP